ncbi:LOW QUALITY PROTEIN: hypothetical protein J004_05703, partial [Cryptococcus neoformans]
PDDRLSTTTTWCRLWPLDMRKLSSLTWTSTMA